MLLETLKAGIARAVKEKDDVARDVLRLALGEAQTHEARNARPLGDDELAAIVRKLVKSNEETLQAMGAEDARSPGLRHEIAVLSALLPKGLSVEQITLALAPVADAIRAAKNDGQATGIAMKQLKATGASVSGNEVSAAVRAMRG